MCNDTEGSALQPGLGASTFEIVGNILPQSHITNQLVKITVGAGVGGGGGAAVAGEVGGGRGARAAGEGTLPTDQTGAVLPA